MELLTWGANHILVTFDLLLHIRRVETGNCTPRDQRDHASGLLHKKWMMTWSHLAWIATAWMDGIKSSSHTQVKAAYTLSSLATLTCSQVRILSPANSFRTDLHDLLIYLSLPRPQLKYAILYISSECREKELPVQLCLCHCPRDNRSVSQCTTAFHWGRYLSGRRYFIRAEWEREWLRVSIISSCLLFPQHTVTLKSNAGLSTISVITTTPAPPTRSYSHNGVHCWLHSILNWKPAQKHDTLILWWLLSCSLSAILW